MSGLELVKETHIVFREHTEVLNLIFEVGDALYTHTQGKTFVTFGVDTAGIKHVGVHHTAAKNLHPSGVLAERASLAPAEVA